MQPMRIMADTRTEIEHIHEDGSTHVLGYRPDEVFDYLEEDPPMQVKMLTLICPGCGTRLNYRYKIVLSGVGPLDAEVTSY